MSDPKVSATAGGIAIAGNNTGNLFALQNPTFNLTIEQALARTLPTYLGQIITQFAAANLTLYGEGLTIELATEIVEKLGYNGISTSHMLITDYSYYSAVLEQVYRGVEQENPDVRRMVRRRVSQRYSDVLEDHFSKHSVPPERYSGYVRTHAVALVKEVVMRLTSDYTASDGIKIVAEVADLGISLLVVDAAVSCAILERPPIAITA